jgi:hypothetical protein
VAVSPKPMKNQRCQPDAPGQEGEGGAGVVVPSHVKKRGDVATFAVLKVTQDQCFGELVEQDDGAKPSQGAFETNLELRMNGQRWQGATTRRARARQPRRSSIGGVLFHGEILGHPVIWPWLRPPFVLHPHHKGCWCSGRTSLGGSHRGQHRRGSASNVRIFWRLPYEQTPTSCLPR